jgi:S-adenosylmethionine-diacylgycerolhomoserine-N-methlytransferase
LELLPSGGEIHIVDFGSQEALPPAFRKFLFWFLDKFHVYYKPEIMEYLNQLVTNKVGSFEVQNLYRGYTYRAIFKKA